MKIYLFVFMLITFSIILLCTSCANVFDGVVVTDIEQTAETGKIMPVIEKNKFVNPFPPDVNDDNDETPFSTMFRRNTNIRRPKNYLPDGSVDIEQALPNTNEGLYVTLLGHSSVLMQIDGVKVLIDPVFSNNASPVFFYRVRRFQKNPPIKPEDLPQLDAVFISHNHYDHLDRKSIKALSEKTSWFFVPLGVGKIIKGWGVDQNKIKEFNWWEETAFTALNNNELNVAFTPARHFSGRGLFSMNEALWGSWVIIGKEHRVFYSGDTGYGFHFSQIGYHYGPFDLTIMENGQYNTAWSYAHLFPEQTVNAHIEINGKALLPVHWGSFTLAPHNWWDPPEETLIAANELEVKVVTPRIGESIKIDNNTETDFWWRQHIPSISDK